MERHYTEQEVTQVIRRAAELQERLAPSDTSRPHGVGERELVRIASELGLEEKYVREAMGDPATFAQEEKGRITAMDRTLERTAASLPGTRAFEIALDEFGPSMGVQSGPNTVGDTMTYQSMAGLSHCDMLVSKRGDSTRVKVGVSTFLPSLIVGMPMGLATFITAVSLARTESAAAWIAGIGGAVTAWWVTRTINKWSNKRVVERLEKLIGRLNDEAGKVSREEADVG